MLLVEMAGFCGDSRQCVTGFTCNFPSPNPSNSHVLQGGKRFQRGSVSCPKSHSHLGAEGGTDQV